MSSPDGVPHDGVPHDDDAYWQRPDPASVAPVSPAHRPAPDPGPRYEGPPRPVQPPPHWRPPTIAIPPEPRALPPQDMEAIDEAEGSARTVTYGVGLVAGAIALVLLCLICGRIIF